MRTPGQGSLRWVRAGVLALLTVLISVGGHALAGGSLHLSMPMLLGGAALGALCVAAADVRRSFAEILAVVLLAQPVLHLLASMGGHGSTTVDTGGSAVPHVEAGMVLAHVVAALVVSLLLADAERAFWTLAGLLAPMRVPRLVTVGTCGHPPVPVRDGAPTPLHTCWLTSSLWQRGPPVELSAS